MTIFFSLYEPEILVSEEYLKCEVSVDDECTFTEEEDDLEETVNAVQWHSGATAGAISVTSSNTPKSPPVVDFVRNFLFNAGMSDTLHCFQTEWYEMIQKRLVDEDRVDLVPDVYFQNQRLESELESARLETEESRRTASAAAGALERLQRAADVERLRLKRLIQENKILSEECRKLRMKCEKLQPTVQQRMNEKPLAARKELLWVTAEKDKSILQPQVAQQRSSSPQLRIKCVKQCFDYKEKYSKIKSLCKK
uniref:Uncharacterized protein n=1 Tax=Oryzias latipes TaxID=8090 RepID=A0A3P9IC90_ORYLA